MSFPLDPSGYELQAQIGRGGSSVVYKAMCKANNKILAVKQIDLENFPITFDSIQKQITFWAKCSHPNIVSYYGSFVSKSTLWILTEYMAAGSVADIMKFGFARGIKNEAIVSTILFGVLKALHYFHENHEIHRDVRASNILISSSGEVKLGDFGLATSLIQDGTCRSTAQSVFGDACYMAPEILKKESGYSEHSDIWSLGLTIIEMVTGKLPYEGATLMESIASIIDNEPPRLPENEGFSKALQDFVKQCLVADPLKRATSMQLLKHSFLKSSKGPECLVSGLLLQLGPLEERYNLLHGGNGSPEERPKTPPKPKAEFVFISPEESPNVETEKSKPEADKDEKKDADKEEEEEAKAEIEIRAGAESAPAAKPAAEGIVRRKGRFTVTRSQQSSSPPPPVVTESEEPAKVTDEKKENELTPRKETDSPRSKIKREDPEKADTVKDSDKQPATTEERKTPPAEPTDALQRIEELSTEVSSLKGVVGKLEAENAEISGNIAALLQMVKALATKGK